MFRSIVRSRPALALLAALALAAIPGAAVRAHAGGSTPSYTYTDLGVPPGAFSSTALGINDGGQVVGQIIYTTVVNNLNHYVYHPAIWNRDASGHWAVTDLGTFGGIEGAASGINSQGEVVGWASDAAGSGHTFLIRPAKVNGSQVWYQDA